jgi:Uma2 family endonuclease
MPNFEGMPGAVKILPYYTYEDYVHWEGRWELIDGIPYAMSPASTPKHQMIANTLGALFYLALKQCANCTAYQAIDYKIAEDTIVQPDLSILCQKTTKKFIDFAPALVVEILSPSTALKDRHVKSGLYAGQLVPYFIIVSPDTEEVEVYALEEKDYILVQKGKAFTYTFDLPEGCTAAINFSELWK